MTSEIPSVTSMNGYGGSISNTTIRPFVTGFIPVVGGGGGPSGILVMPRYPTMADFQPNYASPLGATREAIFQHVQEAKQLVATEKLRRERAESIEDSKALAAEQARLRERTRSGVTTDDPPLRIGQ